MSTKRKRKCIVCKSTVDVTTDESIGYCLSCGERVSACGKPFSANIACPGCGAVNVYEESQQPRRLAS